MDDEELEDLYACLMDNDAITVCDDVRWLIEEHWPHLLADKVVPPKEKQH